MEPAKRTKLTVQFPGNTPEWNTDNIELPVEVRRLDSALVGRTLATGSLDVEPGTYVARAAAAGGEFAGSVEVPPGQAEASVVLRFYDRSGQYRAVANGAAATLPSHTAFDLLAGHLLLGHSLAETVPIEQVADGRMRVAQTAGSTVLRAKSACDGQSLIWSIPESVAAHLAWVDATNGIRPDVRFHFDHPQAQLLLTYLTRSAIAEAQLAARSATLTAAQLLRGKKWDPLAGALGAYVLLSQSDTDAALASEVHQRSEQLCNYNPTFPDAWCIRAECSARAGEHRLALDALLRLNDVGIPFFSAGLGIAGSRVGDYLRPDAATELDDDALERATVLLRRLRWFGLHAGSGEPILKLANFDPGDATQYEEFWRATEQ